MSGRGRDLSKLADGQIGQLVDAVSRCSEEQLSLRCRGREKLGDGTVAACAAHTAGNYLRIAEFATRSGTGPDPGGRRNTRSRRLVSALRAPRHSVRRGRRMHADTLGAANADRETLLAKLITGREAMGVLADLRDDQLDSVPAATQQMRFADGTRTLEQIVRSVLKHQDHQVQAVVDAVA